MKSLYDTKNRSYKMKKITVLTFACLLLASFSYAATTIKTNGKQETLKKDSVVTLDGSNQTEINDNGTTIIIPQGIQATVSKDAKGRIIIKSNKFSGVTVNGSIINSDGYSVLRVDSKKNTVSVAEGANVQVIAANGNVSVVKAGQTLSNTAAHTNISADTASNVPAFVLPVSESAANQQAVQNAEETLSPSAPR